jgi:hypothetical protein
MPYCTHTKLAPLALAAILILLALLPASASAYMSPGEPVADPKVDAWMNVARTTWGSAPACPEGIRIDRAERNADVGVVATAEMPGCHISLDPDYYPAPSDWTATAEDRRYWETMMCNAVVHEWGHLLGHPHVSDPEDIMFPEVRHIVAACNPRVAAPIRAGGKSKAARRSRKRANKRRTATARRSDMKPHSHTP